MDKLSLFNSSNKEFIVDTNFFIQSHHTSYPLDVAVSFWEKVKILAHNGILKSIDKVHYEIFEKFKGEDEIKKWCRNNLPDKFFYNTETQEIIDNWRKLIKWANSMRNHYTPQAIDEFLEYENADAWLIAFALTNKEKFVIVTYEIREPRRKNKIKIPDACDVIGVNCIGIIEMFRKIGEKF